MIGALWGRWFDAREHRRAREIAEQNYSSALVRVTKLSAQCADLRLKLAAATGRAEAQDSMLAATETVIADGKARIRDLERQLDEIAASKAVADQVALAHAEVSRLPVPDPGDRKALTRLEDENEKLRAHREHCLKEHQ